MKKLFTAASVGLLALTIFGCGKKTTKNTTKDNSTTAQKTTKNTTQKTTKKTTQTKATTKDAKKEFKLVSQEAYMDAVDKISTKNPYLKMTINGTVSDFFEEDSASYTNEVLRLNSSYYFVGPDNSLCGLGFIAHDFANHHGSDEKYYINGYNEFMVERIANISATEDATIIYKYDSYGYLVSVETKNKTTITGTSEYDTFYDINVTIEYSETDVLDNGFEAITYDEFIDIANDRAEEPNPYPACIFNGTSTLLTTNETNTSTNVTMKQNSYGSYYSSQSSFCGIVNNTASSMNDKYNTIYYKNKNDVLRSVTYTIYADSVYVISDCTYESNNYIKKTNQSVYKKIEPITDPVYIYTCEVEYLDEIPTYKVTLNAGLGKFSDNSKTKEIKVEQGDYFHNVQFLTGYEIPLLENASYASYEWFDESGKAMMPGDTIKKDMTITYGFVESDHKSSPMTVMYFDLTNSFKDNNIDSTTITINYDFNEDKTKGVRFQVGPDQYYTTNNTFTATFTDSSNPVILIYGTIKDICLSNSNGPLSYGNNYVTQFILNEPQNIVDYAFYNLKGLTGFIIGGSGIIDELGEHALDGCSKLNTAILRPLVIKSYALANCGFEGLLYSPLLYNATTIEENVFAGCDELTSISVLIEPKVATLEDESVVYYFDNDCFNVVKEGWVSGWNCGKQIKYEIEFELSTLDQGVKIVVPNNTGDNLPRNVSFILGVETYSTTYDITLSANSTFNLKYASVVLKDSDEIVGYAHYDSEDDRVITIEDYAPSASPLEFTLYNPYENEYSTVISNEPVYVTIKRIGSEM